MGYDTNYNFDEWIEANGLKPIKHLFKKHHMTTKDTLSNETDSYRNFISDQELRMYYSYLMPVAIKAIDRFHKRHKSKKMSSNIIHVIDEEKDTDDTASNHSTEEGHGASAGAGYDDIQLIKKQSLELCNNNFGDFVGKYLKKKLMNQIWPRMDKEGRGYIENVDDLANGIGFIAVLYTQHMYKKEAIMDKPNNQVIQKEANLIALWIAKSYGSIAKNDDSQEIEYKYRVTKSEFQHSLSKWINEYAESEGTV